MKRGIGSRTGLLLCEVLSPLRGLNPFNAVFPGLPLRVRLCSREVLPWANVLRSLRERVSAIMLQAGFRREGETRGGPKTGCINDPRRGRNISQGLKPKCLRGHCGTTKSRALSRSDLCNQL